MTGIIHATSPNGDQIEIHTNPGAAPRVFVNGVENTGYYEFPPTKNPKPWQKWYAWHPVTIRTGDRIWLKPIYRRVLPHSTYANIMSGSTSVEYEYGTIFDVIRGD